MVKKINITKKRIRKKRITPGENQYIWFLLSSERKKLKHKLNHFQKYEENYPTHRIDMLNQHKFSLEYEINKLKVLIKKFS